MLPFPAVPLNLRAIFPIFDPRGGTSTFLAVFFCHPGGRRLSFAYALLSLGHPRGLIFDCFVTIIILHRRGRCLPCILSPWSQIRLIRCCGTLCFLHPGSLVVDLVTALHPGWLTRVGRSVAFHPSGLGRRLLRLTIGIYLHIIFDPGRLIDLICVVFHPWRVVGCIFWGVRWALGLFGSIDHPGRSVRCAFW